MDAYLNELSVNEDVFDEYENIKNLAAVYRELKKYGFKTCYLSSEDYNYIVRLLKDDAGKRNLLQFVYSFFHAPYEDSDNVKRESEEYLSHKWVNDGRSCFGLAMCSILDTISISLDSKMWPEAITIYRDDEKIDVRNTACLKHIDYHRDWLESLKDIELVTTDIEWDKKGIHLRDDHGKDILEAFARKIVKSPYVISVINSLEFHRHYKKLIYDIEPSGIVDLVLYWTDPGFGIAVQTTGRNLRETEKIARILDKEFG